MKLPLPIIDRIYCSLVTGSGWLDSTTFLSIDNEEGSRQYRFDLEAMTMSIYETIDENTSGGSAGAK